MATTTHADDRRTRRLLDRHVAAPDPETRALLAERYLPLARFAASRYATGTEPYDDLLQVACVGLVKAIDRYDPAKGGAFASYAMPTMLGELRRHFRDHGWAVRPPRDLQEHALLVERHAQELWRDLGRAPTIGEIAARCDLTHEAVLEAREALTAHTATSLSTPLGAEHEEDATSVGDRLGTTDDGYARAEDRATLARLLRVLTPRDREIVRLRMQEDLTQKEIGERMDLSQMHVSRLLRAILEKLRTTAAAA